MLPFIVKRVILQLQTFCHIALVSQTTGQATHRPQIMTIAELCDAIVTFGKRHVAAWPCTTAVKLGFERKAVIIRR